MLQLFTYYCRSCPFGDQKKKYLCSWWKRVLY